MLGFLLLLLINETFNLLTSGHETGEWYKRHMRENTSLEMHIEDIWLNGRSTLKTFDPLACNVVHHSYWLATWDEVTCTSEDKSGQYWQYTVNYGVKAHYLLHVLPFTEQSRPAREMKKFSKISKVNEKCIL